MQESPLNCGSRSPQPSAHTLSHHHKLCPLQAAREGRTSANGTNQAGMAPPGLNLPGTSSAAASGQRSTDFSFLTAVIQSSNPSLTA